MEESAGACGVGPGHEKVLYRGSRISVFLWKAGRGWMLGRSAWLYFMYTGLIISSVTRMDDALRGTVLVSSWERVREGVIRQWCVHR